MCRARGGHAGPPLRHDDCYHSAVRRALATLAFAVAILAIDVRAQRGMDYTALVRMYAGGRGADALTALFRTPLSVIVETARSMAVRFAPREMIAAAVFHTEAAASIVDARPHDAGAHADLAKLFLETAMRDAAAHEQAAAVARRWYAFTVSLFASAGQLQAAGSYASEGIAAFPRDASMYFVRGTIAQRSIQMGSDRDLRRQPTESGRERTRIESLLKRAVEDYQRALNIDSHLAVAHLHL